MDLVVQKYGGTSVSDIDKIKSVARHIVNTKKRGRNVLAVVSAMAGESNEPSG